MTEFPYRQNCCIFHSGYKQSFAKRQTRKDENKGGWQLLIKVTLGIEMKASGQMEILCDDWKDMGFKADSKVYNLGALQHICQIEEPSV